MNELAQIDADAQSDELMALGSIFESSVFSQVTLVADGVECLGGQFAISLHDKLDKILLIGVSNGDNTILRYIPPVMLRFWLPHNYPSVSGPGFALYAPWLTTEDSRDLCLKLRDSWEENAGMPILFTWFQLLEDELLEHLACSLDISQFPSENLSTHLLENKRKVHSIDLPNQKSSASSSLDYISNSNNCFKSIESGSSQSATLDSKHVSNFSASHSTGSRLTKSDTVPSSSHNENTFVQCRTVETPVSAVECSASSNSDSTNLNTTNSDFIVTQRRANSYEHPSTIINECKRSNLMSAFKSLTSEFPFNRIYSRQQLEVLLIDYDRHRRNLAFETQELDCEVCYVSSKGSDCIRFQPCQHTFCKLCASDYFSMLIKDGNLSSLGCLAGGCDSVPFPGQISDLVTKELFDRYESLQLSRTFEAMKDVVFCPRPDCQLPVILDDPEATLGTCAGCTFSFCVLCRKTYHGLADCSLDAVDKKELIQNYRSGTFASREKLISRFGKRNLDRLLDEALANEWVKDNAKRCPHCSIGIEKNDGCNKMACSKCGTYFCWICLQKLHHKDPYSHFNNLRSGCFNRLFEGTDTDAEPDYRFGGEDGNDNFMFLEFR